MRQAERRQISDVRLTVLRVVVTMVFAALAVCYWFIQVIQHAAFRELADNNHQRTLAVTAPRGTLFDRDGRVLVENRFAFNISLIREQTADLDEAVGLLSRVLGEPERSLRATIERSRREPTFRPVALLRDASLAQVAAVAAHRLELPGVVIEEVPTRHYPVGELAAHLFGYVGEVTETQLARDEFTRLHTGDIVGQSGLEQAYNHLLMGREGYRRVVVNSVGRELDTVGEEAAAEGRRLQLTIDYDLQRAAEEAFEAAGFTGAAVFLDPQTGEVLSLVSLPAFDPNEFAVGIDREAWDTLTTDARRPLQNRAIQGRYSPGSTFKIVVAVAALEEQVASPGFSVYCSGSAVFYGRPFRCHLRGGHGRVDMRRAIEKSCNVYFYTLGNMVGVDRLHDWAVRLGLGERTGIDLPHETESIVPSTEWKRRTRGERWFAGETISVAIGQGALSVTPVSMAVMMATLANGGTRVVPHLVRAIDTGRGWERVTPPTPPSQVTLKPSTLSALRDGLWLVVNHQGTGGRARLEGRNVAGKTGTAQVISNEGRRTARTDRDLRDHGWFVFFAPHDAPEVAGVVFAEHSEHGYLAAPIARHVLDTYFAKKEGRALPPYPGTRPEGPVTTPVAASEEPERRTAVPVGQP